MKTPHGPITEDDIELAKKLAAACIAHRGGHKSVDYVRKKYIDSEPGMIGAAWIALARHVKELEYEMLQNIGLETEKPRVQ